MMKATWTAGQATTPEVPALAVSVTRETPVPAEQVSRLKAQIARGFSVIPSVSPAVVVADGDMASGAGRGAEGAVAAVKRCEGPIEVARPGVENVTTATPTSVTVTVSRTSRRRVRRSRAREDRPLAVTADPPSGG